MALFFEFLAQQWMLVSGILVCVILLMKYESNKAGASVSPQQLIYKVNKEQAVVVDLRERADFASGHIVDAIHIPAAKLAERVSELEKYKDHPVVLVCKMGQHTGAAGKQLREKGFTDVTRLSGGMVEWQNMQLPIIAE